MSAEDHHYEEHPPRAADIVAQQIEGIIEAAQASADQVANAAQAEADQIKSQARESANAELESARRGVIRMTEEARQEASERLAHAQAAADEVLAEAKAVSAGLRQLGQLLTTHAERILRDVQNSHRAISADLRAAGAHTGRREPADEAPASGRAEAPRSSRDNPFAELDPPDWVDEAGLAGRRRR